MLKRHVTPTRIVLSAIGLFILAAVASQVAVSRRIGFGVSFVIVLACAAAVIVIYTLGVRLGVRLAPRFGRSEEAGRQIGGLLAGVVIFGGALLLNVLT